MKLIILLTLVISSVTTFANIDNCVAITDSQLCIEFEWTEGPHIGAFSKNIVRFKDLKTSTENVPVYMTPQEDLKFFGWMIMASHEHGTRPVKTTELKDGVFENTKIFYMGGMTGTWQFKVKIGEKTYILHTLDV